MMLIGSHITDTCSSLDVQGLCSSVSKGELGMFYKIINNLMDNPLDKVFFPGPTSNQAKSHFTISLDFYENAV